MGELCPLLELNAKPIHCVDAGRIILSPGWIDRCVTLSLDYTCSRPSTFAMLFLFQGVAPIERTES